MWLKILTQLVMGPLSHRWTLNFILPKQKLPILTPFVRMIDYPRFILKISLEFCYNHLMRQ